MSGSSDDFALQITTVQATTFKQVIDCLKEIVVDCSVCFDASGMKVIALDTSRVCLAHLKLEADRFEQYHCPQKLNVGLNMLRLYLLIKTCTANDILTLFILRSDPNHFGLKIHNPETETSTTYTLALLDIDPCQIEIPPADFQSSISMPSAHLQKTFRDMHALADFVEIRVVENQLTFSCKGDFASQETVIETANNNNITITRSSVRPHEILQGVYSLKHLTTFTKCSNLSNVVSVYMRNNYPIILIYQAANLGTIRLCLSQQTD